MSKALDAWRERYRSDSRVRVPLAPSSSVSWVPHDEAEARLRQVVFHDTAAEDEARMWRQCEQGAIEISALAEMLVELVHSDAQKLEYAARKNEATADQFQLGHETLAQAQRARVKRWATQAGWTGVAAGVGLGIIIGGPVGIALGGVGAWLVGGAALGGAAVGATGALTARAFEERSLRTIDEAVRRVHEQRARVSADGRALDERTKLRDSAVSEADARRATAAWLNESAQGRTAKALSEAADMAYLVHEQLCTDYRTILQNKQLVQFHEYVERMSDELLAVGLFRPAARVRGGPAACPGAIEVPFSAQGGGEQQRVSAPPSSESSPTELKAHISALLTELTSVHRGVGQLLKGQLGELDAVLDATTSCTVQAAGLVKHIVQLGG
ncbi:hypothetical protein T492DRAFT_1040934 [Pavlovales sp. CCMP2436]|nr:hypothetical protein T492DRAFT_1040934 [Pavlovales sp. CCMP2436]|mmetsp:Transcript_10846/g.25306  ORF Transcript_10846/g.25306 Transcript_10846/m.25306 type:complete len:386 (+) Transcript_10846:49-1206(+)